MSLLIKALDKAQAEKKAQAKSDKANKQAKSGSKKDKKGKAKNKVKAPKRKKAKIQKAAKPTKAEVNELSLSPAIKRSENRSPAIEASKPPATIAAEVPKALQHSAAEKVATEASALTMSPVEEKSSKPKLQVKPITPPAINTMGAAKPAQSPAVSKEPVENRAQPPGSSATPARKPEPIFSSSERAANVFAANRSAPIERRRARVLLILGAGLIALLAMAAYYYQFIDPSPETTYESRPIVNVTPHAPTEVVGTVEQSVLDTPAIEIAPPDVDVPDDSTAAVVSEEPEVLESVESAAIAEQATEVQEDMLLEESEQHATKAFDNVETSVEETLAASEKVVIINNQTEMSKLESSKPIEAKKVVISESASIEITKNKSERSINPILLRAYDAYNAGNDVLARQSYKDVLRQDALNVDAMLGLAAIATRQGRGADANGWYQKVLSIEPRNTTAQSGTLFLQNQTSTQANESEIKSMLATSPNDANLHVALANLYSDKQQWADAQQAYFEAYRLSQSAENAYNLGVSLDQLNKSKLALPYYEEALSKLSQSNHAAIDQAELEARIAAIKNF